MEDNQIVQLYWGRDQDAIKYTAMKYGNYCTAIAQNILGNLDDAEECVNDTYMNTWNSIPTHRPNMLGAYVGKITRNISFNRYKMNHADKRGGSEIPLILDELSECISGTDTVETEIEYRGLVNAVNEFLAALSEEKRNIFVLRYWYSESVSTIAKNYGMKENTVSMTLSRLRAGLKSYLIEKGYTI